LADRRGGGGRRHDRVRADVRIGAAGAREDGRCGCIASWPGFAGGRGPGLMARPKVQYVCSACGGTAAKWQGQCPGCAEWNTLEETIAEAKGAPRRFQSIAPTQPVVEIADVTAED